MYLLWSISYLTLECNGFSGSMGRYFMLEGQFYQEINTKKSKKALDCPGRLWYIIAYL